MKQYISKWKVLFDTFHQNGFVDMTTHTHEREMLAASKFFESIEAASLPLMRMRSHNIKNPVQCSPNR